MSNDLLKHPALLAWLHACEINIDAANDEDWAEVHNCYDNLKWLFSKAIPDEVRAAYMAEEARYGRAPASYLKEEQN